MRNLSVLMIAAATLSLYLGTHSLSAGRKESDADSVSIGVIGSFTGFAAEHGQAVRRGVELAVADIAKESGRKIDVTFEDGMTSPTKSVDAYRRLQWKNVDAIIGPTWSHEVEAVAPLAAKDGVVVVSTSNLPESLSTKTHRTLFNTAWSMKSEAAPFKKFLKAKKFSHIALIHDLTPWGETQVKEYRRIAAALGTQQVDIVPTDNSELKDWSSILTHALAKSPELLVLILNKRDIDLIVRNAQVKGSGVSIFGSINTREAFQLSADTSAFNNACFTYPLKQLQQNRSFVQEYRERYRVEPQIYSNISYDTVRLLAQAVTASKKSGHSLPDTLRGTTYDGISGRYTYSEEASLGTGESSLVCIRNGVEHEE